MSTVMEDRVRTWAPDVTVGLVAGLIGVVDAVRTDLFAGVGRDGLLVMAFAMALAAGLFRRAPGTALVLVWVVCVLQVLTATHVLLSEALVVALVAFGSARWGSSVTLWASGLSIPAAAGAALLLVVNGAYVELLSGSTVRSVLDATGRTGDRWHSGVAVVGALALGAPWLAGLAGRLAERVRDSRESQEAAEEDAARAVLESEQAHEIVRLREEQTRLARDVHDVVGHSLAVILAQAESAQFLDEPARLKETMSTIATSARSSLQDVRAVLSTTRPQARPAALDDLIDGLRASGHTVESTEFGDRQPMPPELETVAYRVLQEMTTNAIKHGRRDAPVRVERHWGDELRIEVRNTVDWHGDETAPMRALAADAHPGQGVEGMRRRLDSVGGRLDVRRRDEPESPTFTVTAWVPVRPAR